MRIPVTKWLTYYVYLQISMQQSYQHNTVYWIRITEETRIMLVKPETGLVVCLLQYYNTILDYKRNIVCVCILCSFSISDLFYCMQSIVAQ